MMIEVMEIIEMKSETVKSIFEVWGTGMGEERERYTIQVNIDLSTTTTASRKSELTMDVTRCLCKYLYIFFVSRVFLCDYFAVLLVILFVNIHRVVVRRVVSHNKLLWCIFL